MDGTAPAPRVYGVAVRELCEFTAKCGDLDLRFTPSPTAAEGVVGHATVAARRGADYEKEVTLHGEHGLLHVRGRADGYDATRNTLEEVKTHLGDAARIPDNHRQLHWAQLRLYGALLCRARGLVELDLALVYYEIRTGAETRLTEHWTAADLARFFDDHASRFLSWAEAQLAHRSRRDAGLAGLRFPFADFHAGQRPLSEAVYRAALRGRHLLIEAPTGIGKTVGTLFPALKACAGGTLDKVFYLTAKTSGRQLALDAIRRLTPEEDTSRLRTLELVARDTACVHPDRACHGESCPLAKGFYDRLAAAREAALAIEGLLDHAAVRAVAARHRVCPYYLAQDLVRWCDVIVGDYHYYFDAGGLLHALTELNGWSVAVLVDEAHNLVERGRSMYSAELEQTKLQAGRRRSTGVVKTRLDRLNRQWNALHRTQDADYAVHGEPPTALLDAVQEAIAAIGEQRAEPAAVADAALQELHFDLIRFARLGRSFGPHSLFDVTLGTRGRARSRRASTLCIRNVVPAPFLAPRFAVAKSSVLFSATLKPDRFYRDLLGLPDDTQCVDVPSPFRGEQLTVRIVDHLSTRYADRAGSLDGLVDIVATQYGRRPGNYLAFFSSFDYLEQAADRLAQRHPTLPQWRQQRRMGEAARQEFLDRFTDTSRGIGLCVLGGAFGEGIDLPGARLIGAFIATLGLPQMNAVNEEMRERMTALFGDGYDYVYLYPGLRKVVQAAGRVIRSTADTGAVMLIDDRYRRPPVRALLPPWWQIADRPAQP